MNAVQFASTTLVSALALVEMEVPRINSLKQQNIPSISVS